MSHEALQMNSQQRNSFAQTAHDERKRCLSLLTAIPDIALETDGTEHAPLGWHAIRRSLANYAGAPVLFWCVDIGVDLIVTGTDLFGRDRRLRSVEIGRTLLEESRQRFLGFRGAYALTDRLVFRTDDRFDLVYETLLEEPLGGQQCAAGFCRELLRGCGGGCEQVPVRCHAGHEAQLRRPRGSERLSQQVPAPFDAGNCFGNAGLGTVLSAIWAPFLPACPRWPLANS